MGIFYLGNFKLQYSMTMTAAPLSEKSLFILHETWATFI